jgi:hypothetical protein
MMARATGGPEGVIISGLFGTGKTSVAEEIAVRLERAHVPFAAIDLDWLVWFDTGREEPRSEDDLLSANLSAVVRNYLDVGIRFFVLPDPFETSGRSMRSGGCCPSR